MIWDWDLRILSKAREIRFRELTTPLASEMPHWRNTPASDAIAKKWFEEQFGVTFAEEVRRVSVFEVRRP